MAGTRALNPLELERLARSLPTETPRDRLLVLTLIKTGFRVSEAIGLRVAQVWSGNAPRGRIGVPPRFLKGRRGQTRWVPVGPVLAAAIGEQIEELARGGCLLPDSPLFPSRQRGADGRARPLTRQMAALIIGRVFARAGVADDGRLGTHSCRKSFARAVYENCGHDLLVARDALGHRSVAVTEAYLDTNADTVEAAILAADGGGRPADCSLVA